jgi:hypothetical protein
MKVFILKEGKEYNQGVAYLDDGTMVVVDNARKMISKTIDIVVTSVLQTTAGKMIFGRYIERHGGRRGPRRRRPPRRRRRSAPGLRLPSRTRDNPPLRIPPYHWWADGLLSHSAFTIYTIVLGAAVDRVEPVRSARLLRARLRPRVVVADTQDHRRPRRR